MNPNSTKNHHPKGKSSAISNSTNKRTLKGNDKIAHDKVATTKSEVKDQVNKETTVKKYKEDNNNNMIRHEQRYEIGNSDDDSDNYSSIDNPNYLL